MERKNTREEAESLKFSLSPSSLVLLTQVSMRGFRDSFPGLVEFKRKNGNN